MLLPSKRLLVGSSVVGAGSAGALPWCCCVLLVRAAAACSSLQVKHKGGTGVCQSVNMCNAKLCAKQDLPASALCDVTLQYSVDVGLLSCKQLLRANSAAENTV
jgi:hypothetical protein